MKNIKKTAECQQVSERKKKKGEITRHNASFIAIRNLLYPNIDTSLSHERAQIILRSLKVMSLHEQRMLIKLLTKIIHTGKIKIARSYFTKMLRLSERTISRYVRMFEELDLIRVVQVFEKVNEFVLGPALSNEIIRNTLMPILTPLRMLIKLSPALLLPVQVQASDVPLYNMKYLYNNCSINTKSMRKRELIMIKSLELTEAGKISLSVFPTSAIAIADNKLTKTLQSGASVANPFEFLCKIAHVWCKENNVQPEYRAMFQALEQSGITKDAQKFTRILISKATATNNFAYQQPTQEKKHNPIPNFGREGACCYYQSADNEAKRIYLKKQMGAYKLDADGTPIPLCRLTLEKLTCNHG